MNKKLNTVLFILGATVVNLAIMLILVFVLLFLYGRFLAPVVSPEVSAYMILFIFLLALVSTYVIYHRLVVWVSKKIDFDAYFSPLFQRKR